MTRDVGIHNDDYQLDVSVVSPVDQATLDSIVQPLAEAAAYDYAATELSRIFQGLPKGGTSAFVQISTKGKPPRRNETLKRTQRRLESVHGIKIDLKINGQEVR